VTAKPLSRIAAAVAAMAVPQMPVKWTDLISDENISGKLTVDAQRHKVFPIAKGLQVRAH
jgi:hypothetical protein